MPENKQDNVVTKFSDIKVIHIQITSLQLFARK